MTTTINNNELKVEWTGGFNVYLTDIVNLDSAKTYTISFMHKGDSIKVGKKGSGASQFITGVNNGYTKITNTFTGYSNYEIQIVRDGSTTNKTAYIKDIQIEENNQATSYEPFGKDVWYKLKKIKKLDMSTISSWGRNATGEFYRTNFKNAYNIDNKEVISNIFSYSSTAWSSEYKIGITSSNNLWITTGDSQLDNANDVPTWLGNRNAIMYGILATPEYELITDDTLINQLNNLEQNIKSYLTQTNISQTNAEQPFILDVSALLKEE